MEIKDPMSYGWANFNRLVKDYENMKTKIEKLDNEQKPPEKYYAVVRWTVEDIHEMRKNRGDSEWTDEEAEDFFGVIEDEVQDRMTEIGYEMIDLLMNNYKELKKG